jgi:hypothetical protein
MSKLIDVIASLTDTDRQSRLGVFYNPESLGDSEEYSEVEAVVSAHGQERDILLH